MHSILSSLRRWASLVLYVAQRFRRDSALNMASSLSYSSLLSLVPLLAIGLAMLAAFPAFNAVRDTVQVWLFHNLVPQVGEQVRGYVTGFVANAGKLTTAGIVGLAVSAVMVLVTVETSLNAIFRVATARSAVSRLLVYWTALTLGPMLVGASLSLSAWFFSMGDWAGRLGVSGFVRSITGALPNSLLAVAFALLYIAVPNRRVRPWDGVIGGVAAALAFAALRWGFGLYVGQVHAYQSIYGAVAAVPIFLFWMYLSWVVVLFGAELTAALPEWRLSRFDRGGPLPPHRRLNIALSILTSLQDDVRHQAKGRSRLQLLDAVGEGEPDFLAVLEKLRDARFVVVTANGRFLLGRDLESASLADIAHALELGLVHAAVEDDPAPWMRRIAERVAKAAETEARILDIPLRTLVEEAGLHWTSHPMAELPEDQAD